MISIDASHVLQVQAAVLSQPHFEEASATFATHLAQAFGFDRASVGFVEDGYARVVAVSHGAALDTALDLNREVAAVMDEAIDQAATIVFPPPTEALPRITLCHAALARRSQAGVCTIPLVDDGAPVGAVTVEFDSGRTLDRVEVETWEHLVSLAGPVLALKRRAEMSLSAKARQNLRSGWSRFRAPGETGLRLSVGAAAAFVLALCFIPLPYTVTAPARLEGSIQRAVVAASDGYLQQVSVRPGDAVRDGQVLAELAQHDLVLERSKWESELAQQVNAYGAALARADRALLMVNHAKAAEARAQLELIEKHIERAQLRAPFDGIVISGDLTQSLGAPVRRGDTLLVVAPRDSYRLIVEVDERDIPDVRDKAAGRVALAAMPAQPLSFQVQRITPISATREGRHFFEVEGRLDASVPALRPGLQGIARIEAEARPLASRAFGRLLAWFQLKLWSWGWEW